MTTDEKYFWLLRVLYRAGDRGLTLQEISDKWEANQPNSIEPLPRQTFIRWKERIYDMLNILIVCRRDDGYRYYIQDRENLSEGKLVKWLLDIYSTTTILSQSTGLKERILVEEVSSGQVFLTDIVEAMKENRVLQVSYQGFEKDKVTTFSVEPYCLKMFERRWYLYAHSIGDDMMRIYGLDRMKGVEQTTRRFVLPDDFDAKRRFLPFYGVFLDSDGKTERVVLRAYNPHYHYMRTLPLHASQKEISSCDDYADFELHLHPTCDFVMELLSKDGLIEVLEPAALREEMLIHAKELMKRYKK
jgi:hypothetical protein